MLGKSCPVYIELQNYRSSNVSLVGESIEVVCRAGFFNLSSYKCDGSGHMINTTCDGKASAVVKHTCPPIHLVASCVALTSVTAASCSLFSYTLARTTCVCEMSKKYASNSTSSATSDEIPYDISITSLLNSVLGNSESVILSAAALNASEVTKQFAVLATFLTLLVLAVVCMSVGHYFDLVDTNKVMDEKSAAFKGAAFVKRMKQHFTHMPQREMSQQVAQKNNRSARNSQVVILDDALPTVLANRSLAQKVQIEVKHQHRWLGIVYHHSDSFPRSLRVLSLIVNIVVMLFVQSITYELSKPDTGACKKYETKSACLTPRSTMNTGSNMCSWHQSSTTAEGSCAFVEPSDDFLVVMFVAIFSALISTPIAIAQGVIIRKCLAPRLRVDRDQKIVPEDAEQVAERHLRPKLSKLLIVEKEMSALIKKVQSYRNSLSPPNLREFDMLWGLDAEGRFYGSATSYASTLSQICGGTTKPNVYNIIITELSRLREEEERHVGFIESDAVSDKEKERRLIHWFQCDLLPGISGQILASKCARDHNISEVKWVSFEQKCLGYAVIVSLNLGMVFYIFLFALQQSNSRQSAWLQSFLLWLFTEIVFVSTLTVLVLHVVVPSFIMKDIAKLREKIADIINDYGRKMRVKGNREVGEQKSDDGEFNATDFFFLSKKLAQRVPHLRAAQLISQFRTPWPRQSYQHVQDVSLVYTRGLQAGVGNFIGTVLVFFLASVVNFPHSLQDGVVHMVGTTVVGYLVVLHSQLFLIAPVLAFLPLFVFVIVVHFTFQFCKSNPPYESHHAVVPVSSSDHTSDDAPAVGSLSEAIDRARIRDNGSDISDSNFSVSGFEDIDSAPTSVKHEEEGIKEIVEDPPLDEGSIYFDDDDHESEGGNSEDISFLMESFQKRFIEEMTKVY